MSDSHALTESTTEDQPSPADIITREELLEQIRAYEIQYEMTSAEFLRQWEAGVAPDTYETNVWAMILDVL